MLPKKERLSRQEFNRFFSVGKRSHSPLLQLVYVPHTDLHASVVVPKKVAKLAVARNKIRRRIYDIVRHYRDEQAVSGVFIFLAKQGIHEASYEEIKHVVRTMVHDAERKNK